MAPDEPWTTRDSGPPGALTMCQRNCATDARESDMDNVPAGQEVGSGSVSAFIEVLREAGL